MERCFVINLLSCKGLFASVSIMQTKKGFNYLLLISMEKISKLKGHKITPFLSCRLCYILSHLRSYVVITLCLSPLFSTCISISFSKCFTALVINCCFLFFHKLLKNPNRPPSIPSSSKTTLLPFLIWAPRRNRQIRPS